MDSIHVSDKDPCKQPDPALEDLCSQKAKHIFVPDDWLLNASAIALQAISPVPFDGVHIVALGLVPHQIAIWESDRRQIGAQYVAGVICKQVQNGGWQVAARIQFEVVYIRVG